MVYIYNKNKFVVFLILLIGIHSGHCVFANNVQYTKIENINKYNSLNLQNTLENMNFILEWNNSAKKFVILNHNDNSIIEIYTKSKFATKNNRLILLSNQIEITDEKIYISEEAIELLFGLEILINVDRNEIYTFYDNDFTPIFKVYEDIPENVITKMLNVSLPDYEESKKLSMVEITHIDLYGNNKIGNLIVKKELANDVCEIFEKLYEVKFPINSILLIENFNGDDLLSMQSNNTSAFNYRYINGTRKLSNHSYGTAIDINPLLNPHVINNIAYPIEGQMYVDRSNNVEGMINENDYICKLFEKYGWSWGGIWQNPDYQHFEKYSNNDFLI